MSRDRAGYRNVRLYDASTGNAIGGFRQNGSITEANLISILNNVLLIMESGGSWTIQHRTSGRNITPSAQLVEAGDYDIYPTGSMQVIDEPWVPRLITHSASGGREGRFRDRVRARDGGCVITGQGNPGAQWNDWVGLHAAHIFPLERESLWTQLSMDDAVGVSRINSVQNGLLMSSTMHIRFVQYLFSINPDDGYKIIEFGAGPLGVDGRILDPVCRDPNNDSRVSDGLLQWHFRQSVLANMRGAGEPIFESDFPPGSDRIATFRDEPYGQERLELEMSSRLRRMAGD